MKLFTYGTLKRRSRLEALAGKPLTDPQPATLAGYRRFLTSHGYPVILPDPNHEVEGLIWEVDESAFAWLDHYEGLDQTPPYYFRQTVTVQCGGEQVEAEVYVGNADVWRDVEAQD